MIPQLQSKIENNERQIALLHAENATLLSRIQHLEENPPQKKAVLMGLNYRGSAYQLKGCINDVIHMKAALMTHFGFSEAAITVMTDDTPALLPTRSNIENTLVALVQTAVPGDLLVVHFSGHGTYIRDTNGDELDRRDECLVPLDFAQAGMISDDWLFDNVIQALPAGVSLRLFSDSCHSGTVMDLKHNYRSSCRPKTSRVRRGSPYVPSEWTDRFAYSTERKADLDPTRADVWLFSGAYDLQYAADAFINNIPQGAFTYCLLQAFQTLQNSSTYTLRDLLKEVNARLQLEGYRGQRSQLSLGQANAIDQSFLL